MLKSSNLIKARAWTYSTSSTFFSYSLIAPCMAIHNGAIMHGLLKKRSHGRYMVSETISVLGLFIHPLAFSSILSHSILHHHHLSYPLTRAWKLADNLQYLPASILNNLSSVLNISWAILLVQYFLVSKLVLIISCFHMPSVERRNFFLCGKCLRV